MQRKKLFLGHLTIVIKIMTQSIYLTKVLYLAYNLAIDILILTDHQKYVGIVL